jgi:hypothetical protein
MKKEDKQAFKNLSTKQHAEVGGGAIQKVKKHRKIASRILVI